MFFSTPSTANTNQNAYDFTFQSIDGKDLPLSEFKGKAVLVVNTASQCGFTKQYAGLQDLYKKYQDQGLVVLGIPSNNFGGQEPGSEEDIKQFCESRFGITFPMTSKTDVVGDNAHPFYIWAKDQKKGGFLSSKPRWNFHKYLVDQNGDLIGSYGSMMAPTDSKLEKQIVELLGS